MHVAIIQNDEVENELDIMWHCASCTRTLYGWSQKQYEAIKCLVDEQKPIPVSEEVSNSTHFGKYVKDNY